MSFTDGDYARAEALIARQKGLGTVERSPPTDQKLGRYTLVSLPLNRTIGSGIFVAPGLVLKGTGSVGASLLLWTLGGFIATAGLLVWLQLGLSIPRTRPTGVEGPLQQDDDGKRPVPRSGGEKNYLEYIYKRQGDQLQGEHRLTTCMFGIPFILLGNLSGNAIALGIYVMVAAGHTEPTRRPVIVIAITALILACLLHVASRRGGIVLNNLFATAKVLILVAIIILGFIRSRGYTFGGKADPERYPAGNFNTETSFQGTGQNTASFVSSLLFVIYAYSGFEQPFYVLSEVKMPRKRFPKYTLIAMAINVSLFLLVNIAFLCAVPKNQQLSSNLDMATLFFQNIFGGGAAPQVMAAIIAFSIFGNLVVMTFTASRVKQEIAKEGILPFSLFFACSRETFISRLLSKHLNQNQSPEQTPIPALGLHWLSSVILIAVTSALKPKIAYTVLTGLYSYTIVAMVGFFVSGGLLTIYFSPKRKWAQKVNYHPFTKKFNFPLHALFYFLACGFLLFAAFAPPSGSSPFRTIAWYVVPTIGLSAPLWGFIWWLGIQTRSSITGKTLEVHRIPSVDEDGDDEGHYILRAEIIDHSWVVPHHDGRRLVINEDLHQESYELQSRSR